MRKPFIKKGLRIFYGENILIGFFLLKDLFRVYLLLFKK